MSLLAAKKKNLLLSKMMFMARKKFKILVIKKILM